MPHIKHPDLLIYLKADIPILVDRIEKRGRAYENMIRLDYLRDLNRLYEAWISSYHLSKVLVVDANKLNFDNNVEDMAHVISMIESEIHGLFS